MTDFKLFLVFLAFSAVSWAQDELETTDMSFLREMVKAESKLHLDWTTKVENLKKQVTDLETDALDEVDEIINTKLEYMKNDKCAESRTKDLETERETRKTQIQEMRKNVVQALEMLEQMMKGVIDKMKNRQPEQELEDKLADCKGDEECYKQVAKTITETLTQTQMSYEKVNEGMVKLQDVFKSQVDKWLQECKEVVEELEACEEEDDNNDTKDEL